MSKERSRLRSGKVAGIAGPALMVLTLLGCAGSDKNLTYFGGERELSLYEEAGTRIESVDDEDRAADPAAGTFRPRTIRDHSHDEIWDLSLEEAIHLALVNNRVARTRNDFLSPGSNLLNNPEGIASVYDPAIRDTGVLFGTRGVESALAAFDTQWVTNMTWGRSLAIQHKKILREAMR